LELENTKLHDCRLLIVDDEPLNVTLLEEILIDADFTNVKSTTDPREVLPLHEQNDFDLILLDIRMPHMSGIEVLKTLSKYIESDFFPVLVLTAQTDKATRFDALNAGATDFLTKPFEQWEILLRIKNMLRTRLYYKGQKFRADELEKQVRERTAEIRETQLKIIQCLGQASEYRDNETGYHVIRMSRSCQLLALEAGLTEVHAEKILFASPMHDVGKIGIRDDILLKPGKLSEVEYEEMKSHSHIGAEIIGEHSSELLELAREIATCHHERWDGSGYPNGLKGKEIPIESRIASICDVFDALTSVRPYKAAWSTEEAVSFLKENAGTQFDPELAALFINIVPKVVALRDEYPDE